LADNTINIDTYSIQENWMEKLAPKYFDLDTQNMLRVGLLGYINEMHSNLVEDAHNLTNNYYNEILPVRAVLPETIYTNASLVKYDDFNAKSASAYFTLAISTEDLKTRSLAKIDYKEFYISKNSYFIIDNDKKFMIEYPIIIKCKELSNGNWVFTPMYDLSLKSSTNEITTPYINSVVNKVNNEEFLFMNIKAFQLNHTRKTFVSYSDNVVNNLVYNVEFEGKLSHFNLLYQDPSDPNANNLTTITPYFVDNLSPEDDQYCFYKILSDSSFELTFSVYESCFRPEMGSTLIVDIYTTLGAEGNFNYIGTDVAFVFQTDKYVKETMEMDYTRISQIVTMDTTSKGGRDEKSLDEIKQKVIEEFSVRKSIVTESDLNVLFNDLREDSLIQFIKKRDDILQRLFSAYILFRDKNKTIIPTNTVTLKINENAIDTYSNNQNLYMYKAGKPAQLETNSFNLYSNLDSTLSTEEINALEDKGEFFVSNPFLIRCSFNPVKVTYYSNSINETYTNIYTFINRNSYHEFAVNEVTIERNAYKTDDYTFTFNLTTNLDLAEIIDNNNKDTGIIKLKGIFKSNNQMIGYIDFKPKGYYSNNKITYEAKITTTDFIDIDEMMEFENSIKIEENSKGITLPSSFLPYEDLKLEICCFYKNASSSSSNTTQRLSSLSELQEYTLVNIYETEQDIKLFENLDSIINSKLSVGKTTDSNFEFRIESSPVVRYNYLKNIDPTDLLEVINDYIVNIEDNLDKLENNFNVDLKFANTYGKSNWFVISDGDNVETIDRTNISLNFRIKTKLQVDSDNINEIKDLIVEFVEKLNTSEGNVLYISNLIRQLEDSFDYIIYVHFKGINDYDSNYQIIENAASLTNVSKDELYNYVPEFINLHKQIEVKNTGSSVYNSTISTSNDVEFTPEVNIEFI
jgi:hypothetical protein